MFQDPFGKPRKGKSPCDLYKRSAARPPLCHPQENVTEFS